MNFLDMGFGEIVVILLVALLVFGPEKMPELARKLGKTMRALKKMTSDLTLQIREEVESEKKELLDSLTQEEKEKPDTDNGENTNKPNEK
ncbi:MAG: twin-arginine translocase subunit TatB [Dehalococcoidales bacterium]|nr:twin-arginine translocase subunit TatB [Dehalococcoidales bacterium]